FTVVLTDPYGNVLPSTPVLSSSNATDVITGSGDAFAIADTRTITATVAGQTATATVTVEADAANPTALTMSPSTTSVAAGSSVPFTVELTDPHGNVLPGGTPALTSDNSTDVV